MNKDSICYFDGQTESIASFLKGFLLRTFFAYVATSRRAEYARLANTATVEVRDMQVKSSLSEPNGLPGLACFEQTEARQLFFEALCLLSL